MSTEKMTAAKLRREVRRMDPTLSEDDEAFRAALVLLSLLVTEPWRPRAVSRFVGVPERETGTYLRRLRENGVIDRGKLAVDWMDPDTGGLSFWLDVSIALGYIQRARGENVTT